MIGTMKSKPHWYHRLTIYTICINLMIFASIQLCKGSSMEEGNERTLSRRRRYLIFPEGSSLQIVYDTYHPVVDYTNLLVVGITGALAWELPTKPVYPEEKLQEIYKNGSLPLLRRNGNNEEINNIQDESIRATQSTYNGSNKFKHYLSYVSPIKETNTMTDLYNKLMDETPSRKHFFPSYEIRHSNSHHSIHPTFRKRSSTSKNTIGTSDDRFHWKLHRTSRYKLYKHLETFIDTTGYNGRACILKALCETGQIKRNEKHQSFLGEMMRAIFSLPDVQRRQEKSPEGSYNDAYLENSNCTERYPKCNQNIWKSSFH